VTLRPVESAPPAGRRRRWRPAGHDGPTFDAADLYRRFAPAVLGYVRSQGAAEPEDLLGEIFLQVVRDLPRFRGDDPAVRRWVFTIAHHRLIDAGRRSARRPVEADGSFPETAAVPASDPFDPDLIRAVGALTADQREVVALRFVADLPIDAVAALTGRSQGAVKALQHRALAVLAEQLGEDGARCSTTACKPAV
jgi:RNA polymerase sigma-70 factor (ECF subfamily)